MCGRYVHPDQAAVERAWHVGRNNSNPFPRRFNVAPTAIVPILRWDAQTQAYELTQAYWGFVPPWWKEAKPPRHTINARSEEMASRPMWRNAYRQARCLIPAEGWYEWRTEERVDAVTGEIRSIKQPYFIRAMDGRLLCFAGIFSTRSPDPENIALSCAILTRASEGEASKIHDRMPVLLTEDAMRAWVNPRIVDPAEVLSRHQGGHVMGVAVSNRLNQRGAEGAQLIEPIAV